MAVEDRNGEQKISPYFYLALVMHLLFSFFPIPYAQTAYAEGSGTFLKGAIGIIMENGKNKLESGFLCIKFITFLCSYKTLPLHPFFSES